MDSRFLARQKLHSVSTMLVGPDRVTELRPIWASLHAHHTALEARGKTERLGKLRDLESSWLAQQRFCERALRSRNAFLVLAKVDRTPVGYALVVCRRHPLWADKSFGSVEVLCVRPTRSGRPSLGAMLSRGYILHELLVGMIEEGRRRGLSEWSTIALEANRGVRRAIERLGGERAFVIYRGSVASTATRLGDQRLSERVPRQSMPPETADSPAA